MRTDRYLSPAGKCPVALTGTDRETVEAWMDAVQAAYGDPTTNPEKLCGSSTFVYWSQQFYPLFSNEWPGTSEDHLTIKGHIRESFGLPRVPVKRTAPPVKAAKAPPAPTRRSAKRPPPPPSKPKTAAQLATAATRGGWGTVRSDAAVLEAERARQPRKAPPPPPKK